MMGPMNSKKLLILIFLSFICVAGHSLDKSKLFKIKEKVSLPFLNMNREIAFSNTINSSFVDQVIVSVSFTDFLQIDNYAFKKKENPIRRAEILFFGSLTIISFSGWLLLSVFNMMIYGEDFGVLRREQFLLLYLGSSFLSIAVVVSDLFIGLKPKLKLKNIEVY